MSGAYLPIAELDRRAEESAVRRELIPLEAQQGIWIPVQSAGGELFLTTFYFRLTGRPGEPKRISHPRFRLTVAPEAGRVVEFVDGDWKEFAPELQEREPVYLRVADLPAPTLAEMEQLRQAFYALYDQALSLMFQPLTSLSPEEGDRLFAFRSSLAQWTGGPFQAYYRALNPDFFDWLQWVE